MNTQQIRDEIAYAQGWSSRVVPDPMGGMFSSGMTDWVHPGRGIASHPGHPIPDTIDAALSLLAGWSVRLYINEHGVTIARAFRDDAVFERQGNTPTEAAFAVALACVKASNQPTKGLT